MISHVFKVARSGRPPRARGWIRTLLLLGGAAIGVYRPALFWTGVGVLLAGVGLHVRAKGCLRINEVLSMSGPYRWVRHPFYLANLLIDAGICGMIGRWEAAAVYAPVWCITYARTIRREDAKLESLFGEAARDYRRRVPALLPWKGPIGGLGDATRFTWSNRPLADGREIPRVLRILAAPLILGCSEGVRNSGLSYFPGPGGLHLALPFAVGFLYALAPVLVRPLKHRRPMLPESAATVRCRTLVFALGLSMLALAPRECLALDGTPAAAVIGAAGIAAAAGAVIAGLSGGRGPAVEALAGAAVMLLARLPAGLFVMESYFVPAVLDDVFRRRGRYGPGAESAPAGDRTWTERTRQFALLAACAAVASYGIMRVR